MNSLYIRLFGCPAISLNGGRPLRKPGRSAERLLSYLALHGERLHPREKLATVLWDEAPPEQARNALKTTLWRLRKQLEPGKDTRGRFIKVSSGGEIGLNWSQGITCDVTAFLAAIAQRETPGAVPTPCLRQAVLGLEGELLEGFYDDWIITERERLNATRARALGLLMQEAIADCELDAALEFGRRILDRDPLRESIHREMIRLHLQLGHRTQALRQYENCVAVIRDELGIDPMPETQALKAQIVALAPPPCDLSNRREIQAAMARVNHAMDQLALTHADLTHRLLAVDRSGGPK